MLGLGFWEIVIIGLIALIVIGPERLPDFAKSVAKFLNEMKRTASELKSTFDDEKDIFKDNIDQLQKLKSDIQSFAQLDSSKPDNLPLGRSDSPIAQDKISGEEQLNLIDPYELDHPSATHDYYHHQDGPHLEPTDFNVVEEASKDKAES